MKPSEPLAIPQPIADFIFQRSGLALDTRRSIRTMLAQAYLQGVLDALAPIRRNEGTP